MKAKKFNKKEEFDYKPGSYFISNAKDEEEPCIYTILPCNHPVRTIGWQHECIEDEKMITLSPSIFCYGTDGKPCWHGYLRNGEFISV